MTRALITGITGFVGSHLAEFLLTKGEEVFGTYRWRSPKDNIRHILNKIILVPCELRDAESCYQAIKAVKPDVIYHLAAQSYVPVSFTQPADTIETNGIGTINLLEAIRKLDLDPIIHVCSSSEVYGNPTADEVPMKETNPLRPYSPYGVSKVGEDLVAYQYWLCYGMKTIRTRMFTHTGPRRGEVFVMSWFAKQIALIEAGKQEPVVRVGNLESVRTFADVRDTVRAYWMLTQKCPAGEVYNIGGDRTMTIKEMLDHLLARTPMKNKISIMVDPALLRPSDVTLQIPDCSKFKKATGWEPEIPFEKTVQDILDYWRAKVKAGETGSNEISSLYQLRK